MMHVRCFQNFWLCGILSLGLMACQSGDGRSSQTPAAPAPAAPTQLAQAPAQVSVAAFEAALQQAEAPQLLDVRTPGEFNSGHLVGARNVDITQPGFAEAVQAELDRARPVLVYCKVGGRSARAAQVLRQLGFTTIYDLKGGMLAWQQAGRPLE